MPSTTIEGLTSISRDSLNADLPVIVGNGSLSCRSTIKDLYMYQATKMTITDTERDEILQHLNIGSDGTIIESGVESVNGKNGIVTITLGNIFVDDSEDNTGKRYIDDLYDKCVTDDNKNVKLSDYAKISYVDDSLDEYKTELDNELTNYLKRSYTNDYGLSNFNNDCVISYTEDQELSEIQLSTARANLGIPDNLITSISVNGTTQPITSGNVDISVPLVPSNILLYSSMSLDNTQKNTARTNIGAVGSISVNNGAPSSPDTNGKVNLTISIPDTSGLVPSSRTINSKPLSSNIVLSSSDIGSLPSSGDITTGGSLTIGSNGRLIMSSVSYGTSDPSGSATNGTLYFKIVS